MGWEEEKWPLLVQSALTEKALSLALALDGGNKDYEIMKTEILKAYQITPEFMANSNLTSHPSIESPPPPTPTNNPKITRAERQRQLRDTKGSQL